MTPKLYIGTYNKYNSGSLRGEWVDMTQFSDTDEFYAYIKKLHKDESDPEYMAQDFEEMPKDLYSESFDPDTIEKIIEFANLSEHEQDMVTEYLDNESLEKDETMQDIIDRCVFQADDSLMNIETQYAYDYEEQGCIEIPEHLQNYFDYETYGKDITQDMIVTDNFIFDRNL